MSDHRPIVVVTGGSKGIGLSISKTFASQGWRVAVVARGQADLGAAVDSVVSAGGFAMGVSADVSDLEDVQRAYGEIVDTLGGVDVLVNNAGIHTGFGPFWEIPEDEWLADIHVNLIGTYNWSRTVVDDMISKGSGRIINLVGGGFSRASKHMSAYATSKTAIMRLTEIMSLELQEHGITTFALSPGLVNTPGNRAKVERDVVQKWSNLADILESNSIPPERAANLALALAGGRFDALSGRVFYATEDLDTVETNASRVLESDSRRLTIS